MKIEAVILDMDGLMLDTEPLAMRAMGQAIREKTGKEMSFEFFQGLIGHSRSDTYPNFRQEYGFEIPETNAVRNRTAELIVEAIGRGEGRPKKGLLELLDYLDRRCVVRAVASSSPLQQVWQKLRMANLQHRVNTVVSGWEVQYSKPDPAIFLLTAKRLDLNPARCLVLEDSPAGIEAAYRAGMQSIMVPDLIRDSEQERQRSLLVLDSLLEVPERLEKML